MSPGLREQQAQVTRGVILEAARKLFAERGYTQAGMRELADAAGVAVQTIYSAFGSKAGVLEGLLAVVEAEAGVEEYGRRGLAAEDPREMIPLVARMHRQLYERCGDIIDIFIQGAATDAELRRIGAQGPQMRRVGVAAMCEVLDGAGLLRPGTDVEAASAAVTVLLSAEGHAETVRERGWSYDRYEDWIRAQMEALLLA